MHITRRLTPHPPKEEYPEEGLHAWVVLAGLALAALSCFLLLRFTINLMTTEPATPSTPPVTARPTR